MTPQDAEPQAPAPAAPARKGRPTLYTEDLGREICEALADGETLRAICRGDGMPNERTVRSWALDNKHPFSPQYDRARIIGYHSMADDTIEIADDGTNDYVLKRRESGETFLALDNDHIQRSRLRVETRKWFLARALPKIYGDKVEVAGDAANPIHTVSRIEVVVVDPKA